MQFLIPISKRYFNRISRFSHLQIFLNFHTSSSTTQFSSKPTSITTSSVYSSSITKPSETLNPTDFNEETVKETLSTYGNDWKRALEAFNWVEKESTFKHNTETYNQLINILGKFFEFDLAWDLINRMKLNQSTYPNHITFRIMFKRYAAAHMVNEAITTYKQLDDFHLKDETSFSNLIDALCDYKHVIEAVELCKSDDSPFGVNTKLYNMMLRGWLKMGWWSKCKEFWEKMEDEGVEKDLHSYSIYMDIVCKSGKPWKTIKLYKEMVKKGIQLDAVAYNTVIRAIGISEGVDVSIRLYHEMIELGCKPTIVTYNIIIKLLCQSGRYEHAYSILDQMPEKGCYPNVMTYHCFFSCLGKPKEILKLFDRMVKDGIRPRIDTYVMLLSKFGRWGFLRPVFIIWNKMEEHGCSPDSCAYNALIDALIQKGMFDTARKYDEEMLARGLSAKPRKELATKLLGEESIDDWK